MAYYFPHDEDARMDPKLIRLCRIKGMKGYGIYWILIEIMHKQNGVIKESEISDISYSIHEDENIIQDIIKNYELFEFKNECYFSKRVIENLSFRKGKSSQAKKSADARWSKIPIDNQVVNANALRTQSERNAIKEKKIKENSIIQPNHPLQIYCEKFKNVSSLKTQLTYLECYKLETKFSEEKIAHMIMQMENKVDLNKKYVSVYLTLNNWLKRELV